MKRATFEPTSVLGCLALVATCMFAAATATCSSGITAEQVAPSPSSMITLGVGDVFEVNVFDEKDLSGVYRVSTDGNVNFPLVGQVKVEGLTPSDASKAIANELAHYLRRPFVSILVKEYNSKKVYVFGEVKRPGTFPYQDGMNIIQALTLAGGFTKIANKSDALVTRKMDGREQRIEISVKDIRKGEAPNFELAPGDIVFIPETIF